ncbi:MAG: nickel insertion protein [Bacillota bacterium]
MCSIYIDCPSEISSCALLAGMIDCMLIDLDKIEQDLSYPVGGKGLINAKKLVKQGSTVTLLIRDMSRQINLSEAYEIIGNITPEAKVNRKLKEYLDYHTDSSVEKISLQDLLVAAIIIYSLEKSDIKKVICSSIKGRINNPALLKMLPGMLVEGDFSVTSSLDISTLALLKIIVHEYSDTFTIKVKSVGIGYHSLTQDEGIKIFLVESTYEKYREVDVIETNIDDMNPQFYDYVCEKIRALGAHEVYLTPVYMKKGRPGIVIRVICSPSLTHSVIRLIYLESSSIGVRVYKALTTKAEKELHEIHTPYGKVRVKTARDGGTLVNISPEYEDCKKIAIKTGKPLKFIYQEVTNIFLQSQSEN